MRSLLVHAGRDADGQARVDTALALARLFRGHVTLHINTPLNASIAMDPFGGAHVMTAVLDQLREQDDTLAAELEARLASADVSGSVERSEADLSDALVSNARLADLIIMSLGETTPTLGARPPVGAVAVAARAPVLALPAGGAFDPAGAAMVAWNGSHEAANALRGAVPLLRHAAAVRIVTIADGRTGFAPSEAAAYLAKHDIAASVDEREAGLNTVEETLMLAAEEMGAALVVMGAYGHSRLRETLFGGVTRFALDVGGRALLLAH